MVILLAKPRSLRHASQPVQQVQSWHARYVAAFSVAILMTSPPLFFHYDLSFAITELSHTLENRGARSVGDVEVLKLMVHKYHISIYYIYMVQNLFANGLF